MSSPQNELAKYRSYSYYHILAICNSTTAAAELAESSQQDVWQHHVGPSGDSLGKYSAKPIGSGGKYCILINGSVDADLTITKASWTSMTAASATMKDRNTSNAVEGTIQISEPRGIMFMDQVVRCCLSLGVDSSNAIWVLKTVFVGNKHDIQTGEDNWDYINTVPPLIFIAYDVTGSYSAHGGEYELSLIAVANGITRLPQYSKLPGSLNVAAASSFSGMLTNLEDAVNTMYNRYINCVHDTISRIVPDAIDSLRPVKYHISCDDVYRDPSYIVSDKPIQYKEKGEQCETINVHIKDATSIEDAIHMILEQCPKIKDEANIGADDGKKYIPKITCWLNTVPLDDSTGALSYDIGYNVYRFDQPTNKTFEDASVGNIDDKNIIVFDYLYTGKNIDVLEFDMKMNMGMVFLQAMTLNNSWKQAKYDTTIGSVNVDVTNNRILSAKNIPVFFGSQLKTSTMRDSNNPLSSSQYVYSMSKHSSLEVLEAKAKITGNSQLLGCVNNTTNPIKAMNKQTSIVSNDDFARFSDWTLVPSFVKMNIKMPRNNDDQSLYTGFTTEGDVRHDNDYAVDWWFEGYYYVIGIDHVFDNGEFYQLLDMIGIPKNSDFKIDKEGALEQPADLNHAIESCYNHTIDCTTRQPGPSSMPFNYPPGQNTPSGKNYIQGSYKGEVALHNIDNYDKQGPYMDEIRTEIDNAAAKYSEYGITSEILAQIIRVESNFNPNAWNKSTSHPCYGLGQFDYDTWKSVKGNIDRRTASISDQVDAVALNIVQNNKATYKVIGRYPNTAGEVYLNHLAGIGGGPKTLYKVVNNKGDEKSVSDKVYTGNNISPPYTAQRLYDWAHNYIATGIKDVGQTKDILLAQKPKTVHELAEEADKSLLASTVGVLSSIAGSIIPSVEAAPKLTGRDVIGTATQCPSNTTEEKEKIENPCEPKTPIRQDQIIPTTQITNPIKHVVSAVELANRKFDPTDIAPDQTALNRAVGTSYKPYVVKDIDTSKK